MRIGVKKLCSYFSIKAYNESKNYYQILNLKESASALQIKKAFRDLAKKYHPDSNKGKEESFKQVNEAYQVLSDQSVKRQYDQVRTANNNSRNYQSAEAKRQSQQQYNQNSNQQGSSQNYRGYQREEGWKNMNFRDQFMYDLYRQQQADTRNFQQTQRQHIERQFREKVQDALRKDASQKIRQYNQSQKAKQAESRKSYEEQERKMKDREYEEYRRYRDQNFNDIRDKMSERINKMAEGVAEQVKDVLRVGEHVQDIWSRLKNKKK